MRPTPSVLFEMTAPFETCVDDLDHAELRRAYSELFDQVAQDVFRRGLDLDDVVVERFLVCEAADGDRVRVPLVGLADRDAVLRCITGTTADPSARIMKLGAVAVGESMTEDRASNTHD